MAVPRWATTCIPGGQKVGGSLSQDLGSSRAEVMRHRDGGVGACCRSVMSDAVTEEGARRSGCPLLGRLDTRWAEGWWESLSGCRVKLGGGDAEQGSVWG